MYACRLVRRCRCIPAASYKPHRTMSGLHKAQLGGAQSGTHLQVRMAFVLCVRPPHCEFVMIAVVIVFATVPSHARTYIFRK